MKKLLAIILVLVLMLSFAACSGKSGNGDEKGDSKTSTTAASGDSTDESADSGDTTNPAPTTAAPAATAAADADMKDGDVSGGKTSPPTILNSMEYTLYINIFYNEQGDDYVGSDVTKKGTFATIEDRFNDVTRYYVWGYNDATKCCDWQWEIVPKSTDNLPSNGSLVTVKGVFDRAKRDEVAEGETAALDGYWITDAEISVEQEYKGPECDYDLTTMGATLERVQIINIQNFLEDFEGRTIRLYGRVLNPSSIENPYYNDSWNQDFVTEDEVPAIGTCVIVSGTYKGGAVEGASVSATTDY